jgi:hypothetical protein
VKVVDPDPRGTAFHEAAHTVVGLVLGFELEYVTIEPDEDGSTGVAMFLEVAFGDYETGLPVASVDVFERAIKRTLAGEISQRRAGSEVMSVHGSRDRWHLENFLLGLPGSIVDRAVGLEALTAETEGLVAVCWPGIETLAALLFERRRLSGAEVEEELAEFLRGMRTTIGTPPIEAQTP